MKICDKKNQKKTESTTSVKPLKTTARNKIDNQATSSSVAVDKPARLDPTRYGDWEKNGRCIDF